jgi:aromatic ring-opening dioxygenase catalytic subunit (LigB family)
MREFFAPLVASLKQMIADLDHTPKAILMISGHWEEENVAVMGAARPPMIYDYSGFPPHTYQIQYNAPGAPDIWVACAVLLAPPVARCARPVSRSRSSQPDAASR